MKAMILAAGLGKRLRPLTETTPKPLLEVAGKPLLQHHIERLAAIGITELVINTSWLAEQIEDYFGDGTELSVSISWSRESQPLETGGGIAKALPMLGDQPFLLVNGDIWTDFPLHRVSDFYLAPELSGWLLLVPNPDHNPAGDFALTDHRLSLDGSPRYTFSGLSILRPQLIAGHPSKCASFPLRDILQPAIKSNLMAGEVYTGDWCDVGTVERYQELNRYLQK